MLLSFFITFSLLSSQMIPSKKLLPSSYEITYLSNKNSLGKNGEKLVKFLLNENQKEPLLDLNLVYELISKNQTYSEIVEEFKTNHHQVSNKQKKKKKSKKSSKKVYLSFEQWKNFFSSNSPYSSSYYAQKHFRDPNNNQFKGLFENWEKNDSKLPLEKLQNYWINQKIDIVNYITNQPKQFPQTYLKWIESIKDDLVKSSGANDWKAYFADLRKLNGYEGKRNALYKSPINLDIKYRSWVETHGFDYIQDQLRKKGFNDAPQWFKDHQKKWNFYNFLITNNNDQKYLEWKKDLSDDHAKKLLEYTKIKDEDHKSFIKEFIKNGNAFKLIDWLKFDFTKDEQAFNSFHKKWQEINDKEYKKEKNKWFSEEDIANSIKKFISSKDKQLEIFFKQANNQENNQVYDQESWRQAVTEFVNRWSIYSFFRFNQFKEIKIPQGYNEEIKKLNSNKEVEIGSIKFWEIVAENIATFDNLLKEYRKNIISFFANKINNQFLINIPFFTSLLTKYTNLKTKQNFGNWVDKNKEMLTTYLSAPSYLFKKDNNIGIKIEGVIGATYLNEKVESHLPSDNAQTDKIFEISSISKTMPNFGKEKQKSENIVKKIINSGQKINIFIPIIKNDKKVEYDKNSNYQSDLWKWLYKGKDKENIILELVDFMAKHSKFEKKSLVFFNEIQDSISLDIAKYQVKFSNKFIEKFKNTYQKQDLIMKKIENSLIDNVDLEPLFPKIPQTLVNNQYILDLFKNNIKNWLYGKREETGDLFKIKEEFLKDIDYKNEEAKAFNAWVKSYKSSKEEMLDISSLLAKIFKNFSDNKKLFTYAMLKNAAKKLDKNKFFELKEFETYTRLTNQEKDAMFQKFVNSTQLFTLLKSEFEFYLKNLNLTTNQEFKTYIASKYKKSKNFLEDIRSEITSNNLKIKKILHGWYIKNIDENILKRNYQDYILKS